MLLTTAFWHWLFPRAAFFFFVINHSKILVFSFAMMKGNADAERTRGIAEKYKYGNDSFQKNSNLMKNIV